MDEQRVEEALGRLKSMLPVNLDLRQRLRSICKVRQRRRTARKWGITGIAAAVLFTACTLLLRGPAGVQTTLAQDLQVQNQVSFFDIGSGSPLGITEYKGTVYVPISGKGLFAYDPSGFHLLLNLDVKRVKVNKTGNKLVLASLGSLGVYDLEKKEYKELLKGDGSTVYYEDPSWKDENTLLYVKKVIEPRQEHGFNVKESSIYEWNPERSDPRKLGDGVNPSYVAGKQGIVYEKVSDGPSQVIYKNLADGKETVIDQGRFPAVSPDGKYIAYVKPDNNRRELAPNASVQESQDQVWISDTDGGTKRALTANQPDRFIPEQDWLKQLKPADTPQVLVYSGLYSYYNPVWSSDSESLYVLKNLNREGSRTSIMRVDLSKKKLSPEELAQSFSRAKIGHDYDFARSVLKNDQDFVIGSNPHPVSYSIIGSGTENGKPYVDVEENWTYTANPYYSVSYVRYTFVQGDNDTLLIDEMRNLPGGVSLEEQRDGSIALQIGDEAKKILFSKETVPADLRPDGKFRVASLAYLPGREQVVFALQVQTDAQKQQQASVKVVLYDVKTGAFRLIKEIPTVNGMNDAVVEDLVVSRDGRYAALDLFSEHEKPSQFHTLVVDLETNESAWLEEAITGTQTEGTHTFYWDGDQLYFSLASQGQKLYYKWNAVKKTVERP